jgi:hypothetical protein
MPYVLIAFGGVLLLAVGSFALLWLIAPKCYVVHAAHAKPLGVEASKKWWPPGLIRDNSGHVLPMASAFLGCTDGDSMKSFGIPNGSRFVADRLITSAAQHELKHEDIVVVHGKAARSESGYRLRRIDRIEGENALFLKDGKGFDHRSRPLSEVIARVTHIL